VKKASEEAEEGEEGLICGFYILSLRVPGHAHFTLFLGARVKKARGQAEDGEEGQG
jgi:hypothetical protein